MHQRLTELTETIEQAAAALRQGYQPEQLYALRVSMRRIRSLLKPLVGTRSRRFRKTWGGFAAVTNRARDWDVFLTAASELLSVESYACFEKRHRNQVRASHEAVTELLESAHWRRHLNDWREYLRRAAATPNIETAAYPALNRAIARARKALTTAQQVGDDRAWHKLRIAVKEVRYQAESELEETTEDSANTGLIELCKPLQSLLGSWHDCVVQLQLLDEFDAAPEHERLREAIEKMRAHRLEEIQRAVADHPLFEPAGSFETSASSRSLSGS